MKGLWHLFTGLYILATIEDVVGWWLVLNHV
jgi:hypothetical protein